VDDMLSLPLPLLQPPTLVPSIVASLLLTPYPLPFGHYRNILSGRYYLVCVSDVVGEEGGEEIEGKIESRMESLAKYLEESLAGLGS